MMSLPQSAVVRRINELVKRARSVKVHAYIIHYLKKQMPYVIGKSDKQRRLLDRLDKEFVACARRYNLPLGDFPNVEVYRRMLREIKDISEFKRLDKNMVYEMDRVLTHDIPLLLQKATMKQPQSQRGKTTSTSTTSYEATATSTTMSSCSDSGSSILYNPLKNIGRVFGVTGNSRSRGSGSGSTSDSGNNQKAHEGGGDNGVYPEIIETADAPYVPPAAATTPPTPPAQQQPTNQQQQQQHHNHQQYYQQYPPPYPPHPQQQQQQYPQYYPTGQQQQGYYPRQ